MLFCSIQSVYRKPIYLFAMDGEARMQGFHYKIVDFGKTIHSHAGAAVGVAALYQVIGPSACDCLPWDC